MEIEHFGVPQRVGRWLERAGFSPSDARQLSGVTDPSRLLDLSPVEHAFFDAGAHGFGSLRADPTGARWADTPWADPRVANPLEFMTDSEIAEIIHRARTNPSINLSAVPELLSALRREIAARGLPIQLP
jgi:hypothetical protein